MCVCKRAQEPLNNDYGRRFEYGSDLGRRFGVRDEVFADVKIWEKSKP